MACAITALNAIYTPVGTFLAAFVDNRMGVNLKVLCLAIVQLLIHLSPWYFFGKKEEANNNNSDIDYGKIIG